MSEPKNTECTRLHEYYQSLGELVFTRGVLLPRPPHMTIPKRVLTRCKLFLTSKKLFGHTIKGQTISFTQNLGGQLAIPQTTRFWRLSTRPMSYHSHSGWESLGAVSTHMPIFSNNERSHSGLSRSTPVVHRPRRYRTGARVFLFRGRRGGLIRVLEPLSRPPQANRKPADDSSKDANVGQKSATQEEAGVMKKVIRSDERGEKYADDASEREGVPELEILAGQHAYSDEQTSKCRRNEANDVRA